MVVVGRRWPGCPGRSCGCWLSRGHCGRGTPSLLVKVGCSDGGTDPPGAQQSLCPPTGPAGVGVSIFPGSCGPLPLPRVGETEARALAAVGSGCPKYSGHGPAVPLAQLSITTRVSTAGCDPASQPGLFSKGFEFKRLQRSRARKRRGAAAAPPQAPLDTKMV